MNQPTHRTVRTTTRPTVHYGPIPEFTPAERAELAAYRHHHARMAARREHDRVLHARWVQRQAAIAERDRRTRKALVALGVTVGAGVLAGVGLAGWLIWHAITSINWALVVPLALVGLALVALLGRTGHRCITVVKHWH